MGESRDPYLPERRALARAVTGGAGVLPVQTRRSIVDRTRGRADDLPIAGSLATFVDQVAEDATQVTNAQVEALVRSGFTEEGVFEAMAAASLGASLARLERVDELLAAGA